MNKLSFETLFKLIKELAAIRAPSGLEEARIQHFIQQINSLIPSTWINRDKLGNVIITIPAKSKSSKDASPTLQVPRIAIVAHLDEIGGTVYKIQKNGRIFFTKRGGYESRWLISKQISILTLDGDWINGIILGRTTHAIPPEARNKSAPNVQELEIFIGAESEEEVIKAGIHVGAPVVFENKTEYLNPKIDPELVISNSFDDIVGLCVLLELAARFEKSNPFNVELVLAAVVREEIGREGAIYLGRNLHPDICIGVDFGVIESDKNGLDCGGQLKKGPMITWAEAEGRGIFDYNLVRDMVLTAQNANLPFQQGVFEYYGSDAGILQKEFGIPSVLIGIPMLAGHNNLELIALSEIGKAADLIWTWLEKKYHKSE